MECREGVAPATLSLLVWVARPNFPQVEHFDADFEKNVVELSKVLNNELVIKKGLGERVVATFAMKVPY